MAGVCSILAASILILFNTVSVLHLAMQWKKEEILMPLRISCIAKLVLAPIAGKGGSEEERLYKKTPLYRKFEISFHFTLCSPFKELFSVFQ